MNLWINFNSQVVELKNHFISHIETTSIKYDDILKEPRLGWDGIFIEIANKKLLNPDLVGMSSS